MFENDFIIKKAQCGLWSEVGVLVKVIEASFGVIPDRKEFFGLKSR